MKSKRTSDLKLHKLPDDIFLCLCLLLDMQTILSMKTVSKRINKKITELMNLTSFWKSMSEVYFSQEQFASISHQSQFDYKSLLSPHIAPVKTLTSNFQNSPYYMPISAFSFFSKQNFWKAKVVDIKFDVNEIKPLIMQDKASQLFSKVSRMGDLYAVVQKDNFDIAGVTKIIQHLGSQKGKCIISDACFIGLLPSIMSFRAIKSFDLFIQAFLAMQIVCPSMENVSQYKLDAVSQMIGGTQDEFFIQRYLSLMLEFYSPEHINLYKQFRFFADANKIHLVALAVGQLSIEQQQTLIKEWRKLDQYRDLLFNLYPIELNRHKLSEALNNAIVLLKTKPGLDINELISIQTYTQSCFEDLIGSISEVTGESPFRLA